jgi:DNA-binding transcriptional regulator YdaS (Cro superfamily)
MATKQKGAGAIPLATLAPVPDLKLAVVGVVDGRESEMAARLGVSGDKMSRMATVVRDACVKQGRCFFCGKENDASFKQAAKLGWIHLRPILCACVAEARAGYREYMPNWEQQVGMIAAKVGARELDPTTRVYMNTCKDKGPNCLGTIIVTAGDVAKNVGERGNHMKWTRCRNCRKAHQAKRHAQQNVQQHAQQNVQQHAQQNVQQHAQSKNALHKQKHNKQRRGTPLTASVGELVRAHQPNVESSNLQQEMTTYFGKDAEGAHIGTEVASAQPATGSTKQG